MFSTVHLVPQTAPVDTSDEDIARVNDVVTSLVAGSMHFLALKPNDNVSATPHGASDPVSVKELTQMLLLNIFNSCAMTYRGCEGEEMSRLNGSKSTIAGQPCTRYFTGSSYEGIGCASPTEYSDLDSMHVLRNFKAVIANSNDDNISGITSQSGILADSDRQGQKNDTSESITRAVATHPLNMNNLSQNKSEVQTSMKDKARDSAHEASLKILKTRKSKFPGYVSLIADSVEAQLQEITKSLNYGPVIRKSKTEMLLAHRFEFDNAIAVECNIWPDEAGGWESRNRPSNWPDRTLVQKCSSTPCYIVRKQHATNLDDQHEWRFSFARQEAILLRSLAVETKMIYILTKSLLKTTVLQDNLLTTYHLKTLFLWFLEVYTVDHFESHNLDENIKKFLNFVLKHVTDHRFPNFFIPDNNMISHLPNEDMMKVQQQVEYLLNNFNDALASITTAVRYPFSTGSIAEHIKDDDLKLKSRCLQMLLSNFLDIIIQHLFSVLSPNWDFVWMYCRYIPGLMQAIETDERHRTNIEALKTIAETQKTDKSAYMIFWDAFLKVGMLYSNYIELDMPDVSFASRQLLGCLMNLGGDPLSDMNCMADVTCSISIRHGARATEKCCNLWKHVLQQKDYVGTLFMLIMKQMIHYTDERDTKDENNYMFLIGCVAAIANTLQVSKDDIEVAMATSLRLKWSIRPITLLVNIINGVSVNGVLKQFIYLWVLSLEEDTKKKENNENTGTCTSLEYNKESKGALTTALKMCTETLPMTGKKVFVFVVAIIVFQKMTLDKPNLELVKRMSNSIRETRLFKQIPDLEELETNIASLSQSDIVDPNDVFMFAASYTLECITSVGFDFALSILDELTQPHYNLGILAVIWEELFSSGAMTESLRCIETWITRATGAPVVQNPRLTVQMYGKLGHLYHVQALSTNGADERILKYDMAQVMFKTALKEKEEHPAVTVDFLLSIWEKHSDEFTKYLTMVLKSDDICCVSSFSPHSAVVLRDLPELYAEVISRKITRISSVVFAHYMAVQRGVEAQKHPEGETELRGIVTELIKMVKVLESISSGNETLTANNDIEAGNVDRDSETKEVSSEEEVLVGSNLVLGLAASLLNMCDVARKAFYRVLELDSSCKTATRKMRELSGNMEDITVLYSRADNTLIEP